MSEIEDFRLQVKPQPSLRLGRAERTRAAILDAALGILWERPFRELTVGTVMESTGVGRSAFYQYFSDLHDLMHTVQQMVQAEIFAVVDPWMSGVGDPVARLNESLAGLVRVGHQLGPFLRALSDATATDEIFENAWNEFLGAFDDAASARIEADQGQGLILDFDPRPVAIALNRLDASTLIQAFGQHPRAEPGPVHDALFRIWVGTLYGTEWTERGASDLVRI